MTIITASNAGSATPLCDKTYELFRKAPYRDFFEFVEPRAEVPVGEAQPFDCSRPTLRHPKETKGADYRASTAITQCCDSGSCA